jgi:homoserine dehydrogenase
VDYARQLGYGVKLLAVAERMATSDASAEVLALSLRVQPTLVPSHHPLAGVQGVNNAILVEGDPIGQVMFYGPGAGAGPTASAVVADILNIAGIRQASGADGRLDPLLAAGSWRTCSLVDPGNVRQRHYVRFNTQDAPGVIGRIGGCFGDRDISIQSIVQFNASSAGAEIVVITHEVDQRRMDEALAAIRALPDVSGLAAHLGCL